MVRAFIAFPLTLLCLLGSGPLSGRNFLLPWYEDVNGGESYTRLIVSALVISAVIAIAPLWLAISGLQKVVSDDPPWVLALLRAAQVLAVTVIVLRLIATVTALLAGELNDLSVLFQTS